MYITSPRISIYIYVIVFMKCIYICLSNSFHGIRSVFKALERYKMNIFRFLSWIRGLCLEAMMLTILLDIFIRL